MITKDMIIADIIRQHPETLPVFQHFNLDCYECQIADLETLEHGAGVHKVAIADLLDAYADEPVTRYRGKGADGKPVICTESVDDRFELTQFGGE